MLAFLLFEGPSLIPRMCSGRWGQSSSDFEMRSNWRIWVVRFPAFKAADQNHIYGLFIRRCCHNGDTIYLSRRQRNDRNNSLRRSLAGHCPPSKNQRKHDPGSSASATTQKPYHQAIHYIARFGPRSNVALCFLLIRDPFVSRKDLRPCQRLPERS